MRWCYNIFHMEGLVQNIKIIGDNVLISPIKPEERVGSIFIVQAKRARIKEGVVVGVGCGVYSQKNTLIPVSVDVGNVVFFVGGQEQEVSINDKVYWVVPEKCIMAIRKKRRCGDEKVCC